MEFSLNYKKFDKEYLENIKLKILNFYSSKYQNVEIKYRKKETSYTFFVYVDLDVVNNKIWHQKKFLIKKYNNVEAIENFVPILKDKYYKEYDDSQKDYIQNFVEEMESIIILYKTLGMCLTIDYLKNPTEYHIIYYRSSNNKFRSNKYINFYCNYENMMTKEEYKKNISILKKILSEYYDKYMLTNN